MEAVMSVSVQDKARSLFPWKPPRNLHELRDRDTKYLRTLVCTSANMLHWVATLVWAVDSGKAHTVVTSYKNTSVCLRLCGFLVTSELQRMYERKHGTG